MSARLTLHDQALLADPSGALFWPAQRLLIVADLHLEKGSSFAQRGQFLPPYDTRTTLERLTRVARRYRPARVACLGDSFHDRDASARLDGTDRAWLKRLVAAQEWLWIAGNHDPAPPAGLGGAVVEEFRAGPLVLRHQPDGAAYAAGEICGHFHPKAAVAARGRRISAPCFVTDGRRLVMPAFGAYAGGLDVFDPAILGLFRRTGFRVLLLGRERLYLFPQDRLERTGPARPALSA
jgi:DNA ligase-associated metallophosphoesterase